jgi:hypothetical protein
MCGAGSLQRLVLASKIRSLEVVRAEDPWEEEDRMAAGWEEDLGQVAAPGGP